MDHFIRTLFIPRADSRTTCREICKFGILQIAPDDPFDCKVSVVESERGLERLILIWETMARKVDPFVPAKLFNHSRSARFLSFYTRERGEAVDALTNILQLHAYEREFALASSVTLADSNETFLTGCGIRWIAPSGTNEGSEGWGVGRDVQIKEVLLALPKRTSSVQGQHRELAGGTPPDARLRWMRRLEASDDGRNNLIPKLA